MYKGINMINEEYAEYITEMAAKEFLEGDDNWNKENAVRRMCDHYGLDSDFVMFASYVLFGPAVWFAKTGKCI